MTIEEENEERAKSESHLKSQETNHARSKLQSQMLKESLKGVLTILSDGLKT